MFFFFSYIADQLVYQELQLVFSPRVSCILKKRKSLNANNVFNNFFRLEWDKITDLCIATGDLLQPKEPVGGAVVGSEVVLDHFGGPLCGVVIRIQLSRCHQMLLSLFFL